MNGILIKDSQQVAPLATAPTAADPAIRHPAPLRRPRVARATNRSLSEACILSAATRLVRRATLRTTVLPAALAKTAPPATKSK